MVPAAADRCFTRRYAPPGAGALLAGGAVLVIEGGVVGVVVTGMPAAAGAAKRTGTGAEAVGDIGPVLGSVVVGWPVVVVGVVGGGVVVGGGTVGCGHGGGSMHRMCNRQIGGNGRPAGAIGTVPRSVVDAPAFG